MIIFIYGEDTFRSREKVGQVREQFMQKVDASGASVTEMQGKELTVSGLHSALGAGGLFATKRMVVVRDFVRDGNKEEQAAVKEILKSFEQSNNVVLFWEGAVDKRVGLYKALAKQKYEYEFAALDEGKLKKWIVARVKARGGSIEGNAATHLAAEVGADLWRLSGEVEKLIAYKMGEVITSEDVHLLVRGKHEENIFALCDAVANGQSERALTLINHELAGGMNALYLHAMLVRQFRILLQLKGALAETDGRVNQKSIASQLGLHPFVVKKALPQARAFTFSQLRNMYGKLLGIEVKLKSTSVPAGVLFDLFVLESKK